MTRNASPATIIISGRSVPLAPIEAYLRLLRIVRKDIATFDYERSRLHNAIFNAAGLSDSPSAKARIIGYGAQYAKPGDRDYEYGLFNDKLEDVLCHALSCPTCNTTVSYKQRCNNPRCPDFDRHVSGLDAVRKLRKMAKETGMRWN